jgi:hypothetical protein
MYTLLQIYFQFIYMRIHILFYLIPHSKNTMKLLTIPLDRHFTTINKNYNIFNFGVSKMQYGIMHFFILE